MLYVDIEPQYWVKKYPALHSDTALCECISPVIKPFVTDKSVGLVCTECNTGTWIRKNKEENQKLLDLLMIAGSSSSPYAP